VGGLLVMTAAVYAASLRWGYVYEDAANMTFGWSGHGLRLVPGRSLSVWLWEGIGALTGFAPVWQRLVSLLLHLVNGALIWRLAVGLGFDRVGIAVATGLFLLHPLQIEAVVSVAYRTELLIALCVLLACWCGEQGRWWLAWPLMMLAPLVKPAGVVALALVPLWACWRRSPSWTPTVRLWWALACVPMLLISGAWVQQEWNGGRGLAWMSLPAATETLAAWTLLLGQWAVPWRPTIDPDWTRLITWPVATTALVAWGVAVGMVAQTWRVAASWLVLLVAWSGALVLPRLLWQLGEGLHGHHLYAGTIALALATGKCFHHGQGQTHAEPY